jgi:hypothetical protein
VGFWPSEVFITADKLLRLRNPGNVFSVTHFLPGATPPHAFEGATPAMASEGATPPDRSEGQGRGTRDGVLLTEHGQQRQRVHT